ncbi:ribonuclease III [Ascochyta rabiei]|uniref:Ribonuclease III n=1 Tax=Didymella rabiei TaxID=5454 RepID=A0A163BC35_DIDRA|nr:ribonuclease III [Ascochyta rabiei]
MSDFVQHQIRYTFGDKELVKLALRSAHRDDSVIDDGNRGLAHYGVSAISMVETYNAIVESRRTLHDLNCQSHWSKTKKGRASACRALGFEPFITRSARQQHQAASETVLDNALSAVIGAIWLDYAVLESSQSRLSEDDVVKSVVRISSIVTKHPIEQPEMTGLAMWQEQKGIDTFSSDSFVRAFDEFPQRLFTEGGDLSELSMTMSSQDLVLCARSGVEFDKVPKVGHDSLHRRPVFHSSEVWQNADSYATKTPSVKRKRTEDSKAKAILIYHESLTRHLEHPEIRELEKRSSILLHSLYLTIGSWHTIDDFKNQLRLARYVPSVFRVPGNSGWNAAETYTEICRLEKSEALSVLLRRYHTINLFGVSGRPNAGNPVLALDASLTNELLYRIMPDVQPGTEDFKTARRKVKRLRKLAKYLHILVQSYGFGILALLPSGPSFGAVSLTDNMLLSVTEASFVHFSQLLFQEQGPLLKSLSQFVEPSLVALATCSLGSGTVYPMELLDLQCLGSHPKGLLNLSLCPLVSEDHSQALRSQGP